MDGRADGEKGPFHIRDCLKRWVPEAELVTVAAARDDATLQLKVRFRAAKDAGKVACVAELGLNLLL